jgi:hypothetical protein
MEHAVERCCCTETRQLAQPAMTCSRGFLAPAAGGQICDDATRLGGGQIQQEFELDPPFLRASPYGLALRARLASEMLREIS